MLNRSLVYDYRKNQFVLESFAPFSPQIQTVRVTIKNCKVEFIDDPAIRKSLYFHELKDIDKHVKIDYPNNLPSTHQPIQITLDTCKRKWWSSNCWTKRIL